MVSSERREVEELDAPEPVSELEDDDLEATELDEGEETAAESSGPGLEDDDSEQASLDELLAQRAARRRDDSEDEADIMSFPSENRPPATEQLLTRVPPVRDRHEFVCRRCHLVKPRVQLADAERGLCRDCV